MAITIIGSRSSTDEKRADSPLPPIPQDLPPPGTAPEGKSPLGDDHLRALLGHPHALVRSWSIEQASHHTGDDWSVAIAKLVDDADDLVASDAIRALEQRKYAGAVDRIAERFKTGTQEIAAVAASALGTLAPERLLEAVKQRGRLDDEAYAATATSLAIIGSPEVIDFLGKALNRQGALPPERRGSLYGAALLSGSPELCQRVLAQALEDSKKPEPEGASFPSRAALSSIAGLPLPFARRDAGLELFDSTRGELEAAVLSHLAEGDKAKLEEAMKTKRPGAVLAALEPILALPRQPSEQKDDTFGTMPRRRRGLLRAIIDKKDAIDALEVAGGAVFVAAAVQAALVVLMGEGTATGSPALATLAKALETPGLDAERLAAMSEDELTALFKERTERQMRRVHGIITHEDVHQPAVLKRFARAIVRAGHGDALFEAAGDVEDGRVHDAVLKAIADAPELAERAVVEALSRTPLEPKLARFALLGAEEVRTERVALAVGRRFQELRTISRGRLVRAMLRLGDPRLIPLLEARAFEHEPEEVAWVILALAHGREPTEKLEKAIRHTDPRRALEASAVELPLRCKRCGEVLAYGYDRVYVDIETKDANGDPAFVGDTTCKACGTEDQLEPTEEAQRILTGHMLEFLAAVRMGGELPPSAVAPGQFVVRGKKMGFAAALRALDQDVKESPTAIRPRLQRARLRFLLRRRHADEDLAAVLAVDPRSPEAISLQGALAFRRGEHQKAMDLNVEALRNLLADPPARIYDASSPEGFRDSIEQYMLEIERSHGVAIPPDLDLEAAKERRDVRERAMAERAEELEAARGAEEEAAAEGREGRGPSLPLTPDVMAAMRTAGRNDVCPCGSGKKFKKCHGRGK